MLNVYYLSNWHCCKWITTDERGTSITIISTLQMEKLTREWQSLVLNLEVLILFFFNIFIGV